MSGFITDKVAEFGRNPRLTAEAIDEIIGASGHDPHGNTLAAADMAMVLLSEHDFQSSAIRFFYDLRDKVDAYFLAEATRLADEEALQAAEDAYEERAGRAEFRRSIDKGE